jgi:hypothetical protein
MLDVAFTHIIAKPCTETVMTHWMQSCAVCFGVYFLVVVVMNVGMGSGIIFKLSQAQGLALTIGPNWVDFYIKTGRWIMYKNIIFVLRPLVGPQCDPVSLKPFKRAIF